MREKYRTHIGAEFWAFEFKGEEGGTLPIDTNYQ